MPVAFTDAIVKHEDCGHSPAVMATENGGPIIICVRCAAWSSGRRLLKLKEKCPGVLNRVKGQKGGPAASAALTFSRILKGRHPDPKSRDTLRVGEAELQAIGFGSHSLGAA